MQKPRRLRLPLIALAAVIAAGAFAQLTSSTDDQSPSARTKARALLIAVDTAELCHWQRYGRYGNIVDLDETMEALSPSHLAASLMGVASDARLALDLYISRSGKSYVQRITGSGVDTSVERRGADFVDYGADGWHRLATRCTVPTR